MNDPKLTLTMEAIEVVEAAKRLIQAAPPETKIRVPLGAMASTCLPADAALARLRAAVELLPATAEQFAAATDCVEVMREAQEELEARGQRIEALTERLREAELRPMTPKPMMNPYPQRKPLRCRLGLHKPDVPYPNAVSEGFRPEFVGSVRCLRCGTPLLFDVGLEEGE